MTSKLHQQTCRFSLPLPHVGLVLIPNKDIGKFLGGRQHSKHRLRKDRYLVLGAEPDFLTGLAGSAAGITGLN